MTEYVPILPFSSTPLISNSVLTHEHSEGACVCGVGLVLGAIDLIKARNDVL